MLQCLRADQSQDFEHGGFSIRRMRPGKCLGPDASPSYGPLSVIDHAHLAEGTLVKMHEHKNDEILSYVISGTMIHEDSAGNRIALSPAKLMLMNAGKSFRHEESVPDGALEMLQIFVRPREADLEGKVQFLDRSDPVAEGWTLLASPESGDAPLVFRQDVFVFDGHFPAGASIYLPEHPEFDCFVYVVEGVLLIGSERFEKGDAFALEDADLPPLLASEPATLVAFMVDPIAQETKAGTISGLA